MDEEFDPAQHSHRRFNPLTREWILVSPHRTRRPWQGEVDRSPRSAAPAYDAACYLCPGNERAGGARNPRYVSTFAFDNDYPALQPDIPHGQRDVDGLLVARSERGRCRVLCFTPRHDLTMSTMPRDALRPVVDAWCAQYAELAALEDVGYVQIFENRGAMMGASNPHPHGQIWASAHVPNEPAAEQASLLAWRTERLRDATGCLLCHYVALEIAYAERVVEANERFVAVVPYWATWPFETLVLPRRHRGRITDLLPDERDHLADLLKSLCARYDRLFDVPFPYSMGFHQAPTDAAPHDEWHLHAHFYPPLLRSATVRKFMVGFELLGTPQRDITPETAARRLREA